MKAVQQIEFSSVFFDTLFGLVLYFSLDSFLDITDPVHFIFYIFSDCFCRTGLDNRADKRQGISQVAFSSAIRPRKNTIGFQLIKRHLSSAFEAYDFYTIDIHSSSLPPVTDFVSASKSPNLP